MEKQTPTQSSLSGQSRSTNTNTSTSFSRGVDGQLEIRKKRRQQLNMSVASSKPTSAQDSKKQDKRPGLSQTNTTASDPNGKKRKAGSQSSKSRSKKRDSLSQSTGERDGIVVLKKSSHSLDNRGESSDDIVQSQQAVEGEKREHRQPCQNSESLGAKIKDLSQITIRRSQGVDTSGRSLNLCRANKRRMTHHLWGPRPQTLSKEGRLGFP